MSKRSFTARQALAALLAAVCLPFLSLAKPPDLPATSKVECKEESTGKTLFGVGVNSDAGLVGTIVLSERNVDLQDVLHIFCRGQNPDALLPFGMKVKTIEADGSIIFAPFNDVPDPLEDLINPFRPRLEDMLESSWRTLMRWMPITCSPDCRETPTSLLGTIEVWSKFPSLIDPIYILPPDDESPIKDIFTIQEAPTSSILPDLGRHTTGWTVTLIERLPVMPKPVTPPRQRILELLNSTEDLRQIEYEWERIWFTDQPSHLTPQRVHGGVSSGDEVSPPQCERLPVMPVPVIPARVGEIRILGNTVLHVCPAPQAAVRELPFAQFMYLTEGHRELLPPPIQCDGSFPAQATPRRIVILRDVNELPCCVEDNLNRLTRAQQLCRDAEHCCKAGNTCAAARCFAQAAQLCPGSACAAACASRLRELLAQPAQTIVQTAAEEVKKDEKKSSGTRIEIKLTIEFKR